MDCYVTLILLYFGLSLNSCSQFPMRRYYYVNLQMNWTDAQHYCRAKYTDLATIESMDDISRLKPAFSYSWAWIGLEDDPKSWKVTMGNDTNSWKWSATGETSKTGYEAWQANDPNKENGKEKCVAMKANGSWMDKPCHTLSAFVCYTVTNQNQKMYVFISTLKTWSSAQAYCREHHTDLPTIENAEENDEVYEAKPATARVWIGLYRVPWTWSDKTQSSFRYWQSGKPNNYDGKQFCIAENDQHEWDDEKCKIKYPFICHQVSKLMTVVKTKIQTKADLTHPAANTQILQQLGGVLIRQGWTAFKLRWRIQPRKQKENVTQPLCILHG